MNTGDATILVGPTGPPAAELTTAGIVGIAAAVAQNIIKTNRSSSKKFDGRV